MLPKLGMKIWENTFMNKQCPICSKKSSDTIIHDGINFCSSFCIQRYIIQKVGKDAEKRVYESIEGDKER